MLWKWKKIKLEEKGGECEEEPFIQRNIEREAKLEEL